MWRYFAKGPFHVVDILLLDISMAEYQGEIVLESKHTPINGSDIALDRDLPGSRTSSRGEGDGGTNPTYPPTSPISFCSAQHIAQRINGPEVPASSTVVCRAVLSSDSTQKSRDTHRMFRLGQAL